jgi:Rrf2 family transcriptional regulator, iron-sulfur cluster assembly transcription factor
LARDGILKSLRGPRGGYYFAREPDGVTVNDIIRAAGMADAAEEEPASELIATVVLPALSAAEKECGEALSRISLNDMVRAALNGHGTGRHESGHARGDV